MQANLEKEAKPAMADHEYLREVRRSLEMVTSFLAALLSGFEQEEAREAEFQKLKKQAQRNLHKAALFIVPLLPSNEEEPGEQEGSGQEEGEG